MLQYKYFLMYFLHLCVCLYACIWACIRMHDTVDELFPHNYIPCYQVVIHTIRLPKQSTVADVINDLKTKVFLNFFYSKSIVGR